MGAKRTKTNTPPPAPMPEPPQSHTVAINSHDEVAGNMGINDNYERRDNDSEINCPHQSQVTFSQKIWVGEEVKREKEYLINEAPALSHVSISNTKTI